MKARGLGANADLQPIRDFFLLGTKDITPYFARGLDDGLRLSDCDFREHFAPANRSASMLRLKTINPYSGTRYPFLVQ
jgi:hypothetical protein